MILMNGQPIEQKSFPDGTLLVNLLLSNNNKIELKWLYENDSELFALYSITRSIQDKLTDPNITLIMPYVPHARQDRIKESSDVFTLKYFCEIINSLHYQKVITYDVHSNVSLALINNIEDYYPMYEVMNLIDELNNPTLFFPDEGACKRYADIFSLPYCFGIKKRGWRTGKIKGLDIFGDPDLIKDKDILIIDDISSKGGTFYHSAKKLKEMGAKSINLFVTHCENSILTGDLYHSDFIENVYTSDSIFTENDPFIKTIVQFRPKGD